MVRASGDSGASFPVPSHHCLSLSLLCVPSFPLSSEFASFLLQGKCEMKLRRPGQYSKAQVSGFHCFSLSVWFWLCCGCIFKMINSSWFLLTFSIGCPGQEIVYWLEKHSTKMCAVQLEGGAISAVEKNPGSTCLLKSECESNYPFRQAAGNYSKGRFVAFWVQILYML